MPKAKEPRTAAQKAADRRYKSKISGTRGRVMVELGRPLKEAFQATAQAAGTSMQGVLVAAAREFVDNHQE